MQVKKMGFSVKLFKGPPYLKLLVGTFSYNDFVKIVTKSVVLCLKQIRLNPQQTGSFKFFFVRRVSNANLMLVKYTR